MKEKKIKQIMIKYYPVFDDGQEGENTLLVDVDMGRKELINSWDKWMWKILEEFRKHYFSEEEKENGSIIKIKLKQ